MIVAILESHYSSYDAYCAGESDRSEVRVEIVTGDNRRRQHKLVTVGGAGLEDYFDELWETELVERDFGPDAWAQTPPKDHLQDDAAADPVLIAIGQDPDEWHAEDARAEEIYSWRV